MPVVVMEPGGERAPAVVGVVIQAGIGPLEQGGFDEALNLPVGARGVGPRVEVAEPEVLTRGAEAARAIAGAVVGHDGRHAHAEPAQAANGALQKAGRGAPTFIRQHLPEGHAGGVVDGHMPKLPARARRGVAPIPRDPMPRPHDAPQFLGIQVQQLPRRRPFVAARGGGQFEHVQSRPTTAPYDARHGRPTDRDQRGDLATGAPLPPQDLDTQHHGGGRGLRTVMRPRAAIREPVARGGSGHPLTHGGLGGLQPPRHAPRRVPQHPHLAHRFRSTSRRQSGILVDVHPGILLIDLECLAAPSFDETPRMDNPPADNLVRLHS